MGHFKTRVGLAVALCELLTSQTWGCWELWGKQEPAGATRHLFGIGDGLRVSMGLQVGLAHWGPWLGRVVGSCSLALMQCHWGRG